MKIKIKSARNVNLNVLLALQKTVVLLVLILEKIRHLIVLV